MKHLIFVLLFTMRRCFSSAPLSLIQGHISTIYYFGMYMPPKIIPWYNSNIYFQPLMMNTDEAIVFTAITRETINCLNWFPDNLKTNNNNGNLSISWATFEAKILNLDATESKFKISEGRYLINFI